MALTLTFEEQVKDLETTIKRLKDEKREAEKTANSWALSAEESIKARDDAEARAAFSDKKAQEAREEAKAHANALEAAQTSAAKNEKIASEAVAAKDHAQESVDALSADNKAFKAEIKRLTVALEKAEAKIAADAPKLDALDSLLSAYNQS